jgi:drug/metabolite transporter (DMT)-like permease
MHAGDSVRSIRFGDRSRRWWPLVALLVVASARWLVTDTHPEAGSTLSSEALGCAWAAALLFVLPSRRGQSAAASAWRPMLAGAMLVCGPLTVLFAHAPLVEAGGLTMALALTPVVVAVATAAFSRGQSDDVAGRLWPGLAAVAGLLLVLATPSLSDARSDAVLALAPLLTGVGAAFFCALDEAGARRMRLALSGAAAVFAAGEAVRWVVAGRPSVSVIAVAWDGVLALLSLVVLARLGATRWAAQFVLLPLLVLVQGIVLLRPPMTLRWGCGLVLLAVSSVYLLLPREDAVALR